MAPLAKGSFVGLTAYHGKEHMLRAVYEGVVFSHYTHVRKLLLNREKPKAVQLSGGAANSDVWVQIFADVLQIPVEVMEDKELGAMGGCQLQLELRLEYTKIMERRSKEQYE